jgi:mRNA interferase MazF
MKRGEIWWAGLPSPTGSAPGYKRPVLVVQANEFNKSKISTIVAVAITSSTRLADAPGNVLLPRKSTKLAKPSVANVSQIITIDRSLMVKRVCTLSTEYMLKVDAGLRLVLSL